MCVVKNFTYYDCVNYKQVREQNFYPSKYTFTISDPNFDPTRDVPQKRKRGKFGKIYMYLHFNSHLMQLNTTASFIR